MPQVVEYLPIKCKALSQNPSTAKIKEPKNKRKNPVCMLYVCMSDHLLFPTFFMAFPIYPCYCGGLKFMASGPLSVYSPE
jgi:hypothetical protein